MPTAIMLSALKPWPSVARRAPARLRRSCRRRSPMVDLRILHQRSVGGVEGAFRIGPRVRCYHHSVFWKPVATSSSVAPVMRPCAISSCSLVTSMASTSFPAAFLDFRSQSVADRRIHEAVVERHQLQAISFQLRDNARSELDVRRVDHKRLHLFRSAMIDRASERPI